MSRKIKKSVSVLLIAVILSTMFTMVQSAKEVNNSEATFSNEDISVFGENSFGNLISEKIDEEMPESSKTSGNHITDLIINESTAVVSYEATVDCTIIAAIYDENTDELLAMGKVAALADNNTVNINIQTNQMPAYFVAKAFMIDKNNSPLSKSYSTSLYTESIQEVKKLSASDFDADRVLNLDDNDSTNFAVYGENTKVIESQENKNIPVTIDEENSKYVFSNATDELTSLSVGDIFAYPYTLDNVIIIKVDSISVDGDVVTITEADTELEEVFDYVKIDTSQTMGNCEVDDSNLGDDVEYVGRYGGTSQVSPKVSNSVGAINKPFDWSPDALEFNLTGNDIFSGKVFFQIEVDGEIYVSFDECYINFELGYTMGYSISINAKIDKVEKELPSLSFRGIPGLRIALTPKIVFSASASISLEMTVSGQIGFAFSTDDGFSNKSSGPSTHSEIKIEGDVYLGLVLEPSITVVSKKIAKASVPAEAGVHLSAELSTNRADDDEAVLHECKKCVSGKISIDINVSANVKFFGNKKFKYDTTIIEESFDLSKFYYSFDYDEFDWTSCPHLKYLVNASVTKDGVPYPNAPVMVYGDRYAENMGKTDENGKISFYLPDDLYVLSVDGEQAGFVVYKKGADVSLDIVTATTAPETTEPQTTEPEITDPVQDGITWTLNNGVLNIYGSGPMDNYDSMNSVPWSKHYSEIVKVNISKGITSIGSYSFIGCNNLKSIIIPDSVISIGSYAFRQCTKLESVNMPKYIENIGDYCFSECTRLNNIVIPSKVTSISRGMFYGCKNLNLVTLHNHIESIRFSAFRLCTRLTSINIPDSVKSIDGFAFNNCTGLINVNIPDSVISMGNSVFRDCINLEKVTIPNSLKSIPDYTFYGCEYLTDVIIPDNITIIGNYAFYKCKNFADIAIPNSVTTIGSNSFAYCTNIKRIEMPDSVTKILGSAFYACNSIESVIISQEVSEIYYKTFYGCTNLKEIKISDSVKIIGESSFENCSSLININMPSSLQKINQYAFSGCKNLKNIFFNNDLPIISNYSFQGVVGNAYYPKGNSTWEDSVLGNYGGDITWIPYDLNVPINVSEKAKSMALVSSQNISNAAGISTITAEYDNKMANADYIIAVVKDKNAEDALSSDNVLYIDQVTADENGVISKSIPIPSDTNSYDIVVYGPEKTTLKGDVNGDGKVSVVDATDIQKYIVQMISLNEEQLKAADVTGDGKIDIRDVTLIQKYLVELIPTLE